MRHLKLLNFGSLNLDDVYTVAHFVQPGETAAAERMERFYGGKGFNQSLAAARAGAPVAHAGRIGKDGEILKQQLADAGADVRWVALGGTPTGRAIIQVDASGQNCILLYAGANREVDTAFVDTVLSQYGPGDILMLQNEISQLPYLLRQAHERGMRICLNPSPIDGELLACPLEHVTWLVLNEIEGNALSGRTDPQEIADSLLRRCPQSAVVLTLGSHGVLYRDRNTTASHGVYRVERVDTTGAGDTFVGYFMAGVYKGLSVSENLRQASVASSLAVSRKGASSSIPTLREVLHADLQPGA